MAGEVEKTIFRGEVAIKDEKAHRHNKRRSLLLFRFEVEMTQFFCSTLLRNNEKT